MKLPDKNIEVISSGSIEELFFGVADLSLIFDILRNRLYKDPILACCREIIVNARDAHREVGTPNIPIEISLPNAISPILNIRDYGPGISPERMATIFGNYGASTKRSDNIQHGGFGIGSKSPFSYTDIFNVVTCYNYVKYSYICYIDPSNIGKIELKSKEITDEPNGTTISVPVKIFDYEIFKNAIEKCTEFWDIKPIFKGQEIEYSEKKYVICGENWSLRNSPDHHVYEDNIPYAIIDGIRYDIDTKLAGCHYKGENFPFNLYFNVGELSVSAGRDSIFYDQKTKNTLLNRIDLVVKEFKDILPNYINSLPSLHKALLFKKKYSYLFRNVNLKSLAWKSYYLDLDFFLEKIGSNIVGFEYYSKNSGGSKLIKPYLNFDLSNYNHIYVNDTGINVKSIVPQIYKITKNYRFAILHVNIKDTLAQDTLSKLDDLGFIRISDIISFQEKEKAVTQIKNYAPKFIGVFALKQLSTDDRIGLKRLDKNELLSRYKNIVYLNTLDKNIIFSDEIKFNKYSTLKTVAKFAGADCILICDKRAKIPNEWLTFKSFLFKKFDELGLSDKDIICLITDYVDYVNFGLEKLDFLRHKEFSRLKQLVIPLQNDSLFKAFILKNVGVNENIIKYSDVIEILKIILPEKFQVEKYVTYNIGEIYSQLENRYPLFGIFDYLPSYEGNLSKIIDYVAMVDKVYNDKLSGKV